uniref:Uncharacterized protein n=1 Tax=Anguilla anguilla TaxID=7936 RepID=A0A0E9WJB1_ANGAN
MSSEDKFVQGVQVRRTRWQLAERDSLPLSPAARFLVNEQGIFE